MYLVEIKPGTEVLYHSVPKLAAAIRSGEVGPQARIYPRNSGTWVSITVHPEYRKISDAGELPELRPLKRKRWTYFSAEDTDKPPAATPPAEVDQAEAKSERFPMLIPKEGKPSVRQLFRGAMRRLRRHTDETA
jgi:hypothetical protein